MLYLHHRWRRSCIAFIPSLLCCHLLVAGVVNGVGDGLLNLLGERLLQSLGDLAVSSGMADLASLLVGAGVVDGVGELVL